VTKPGDTPGGQEYRSHTHPMRAPPRPAPASRCQPLPAFARATMAARAAWLDWAAAPPRRGQPINHLVAGAAPKPRAPR